MSPPPHHQRTHYGFILDPLYIWRVCLSVLYHTHTRTHGHTHTHTHTHTHSHTGCYCHVCVSLCTLPHTHTHTRTHGHTQTHTQVVTAIVNVLAADEFLHFLLPLIKIIYAQSTQWAKWNTVSGLLGTWASVPSHPKRREGWCWHVE